MTTDINIDCTNCGETPHRFRPSPEAGDHWRCSECNAPTDLDPLDCPCIRWARTDGSFYGHHTDCPAYEEPA